MAGATTRKIVVLLKKKKRPLSPGPSPQRENKKRRLTVKKVIDPFAGTPFEGVPSFCVFCGTERPACAPSCPTCDSKQAQDNV